MFYPIGKRVIIHTRTNSSIRGVLWRKRFGHWVIRQGELLRASDQPLKLDGEVLIEADNIDFVQVLG